MKKNHSFLLVPNHSMALDNDKIRAETAEIDLLKEIQKHHNKIGVAAFLSNKPNTSLSGTLSPACLNLHKLSMAEHANGALAKISNYVLAFVALPAIIIRYDVIYIFCPGYIGLMAGLWARFLKKPFGLYVRGTWKNEKQPLEALWNIVFAKAQFMIVTGESFRRTLSRFCNNVENEVPLTALRPEQIDCSKIGTRSPSDLLFAGRLHETKGILDAIKAVSILRSKGIDSTLTIAGGGTPAEIDAIEQLADSLKLNDHIHVLGHVTPSQLALAYKRCGTFVFPSYYPEGFPRVLYEAMMYQCFIVTCPMPGTKDFLVDEVNCLYCKPKSPEGIAEKIIQLINTEKLQVISQHARNDVVALYQTFTDKTHADQVIKQIAAA